MGLFLFHSIYSNWASFTVCFGGNQSCPDDMTSSLLCHFVVLNPINFCTMAIFNNFSQKIKLYFWLHLVHNCAQIFKIRISIIIWPFVYYIIFKTRALSWLLGSSLKLCFWKKLSKMALVHCRALLLGSFITLIRYLRLEIFYVIYYLKDR